MKRFLFLILVLFFVGCGKDTITITYMPQPSPKPVSPAVSDETYRQVSVNSSPKETLAKEPQAAKTASTKMPKKTTAKDAEDIVIKLLGKIPNHYVIEYDHDDIREGKQYFVVHGYENVIDDPATGEGHTATFGWYYVDRSGIAYEWDLGEDKLLLLEQK